jgi:UDP-perosamine 4-acetyltransferase
MNAVPVPPVAKVVGLGAGGHARALLDILLADPAVTVVGILDPDPALQGARVFGVPVLGGDDRLEEARALGALGFFIGLGSIRSTQGRERLYALALGAGLEPVDILHRRAVLSPFAQHGPGLALLAGAVVNPGARLGADVVVNTGAIVEHDCQVADHVFIATGALLLGGVQVGAGAFLGAGCVVRQGLEVGAGAIVGAGAVVVRNVHADEMVVGNPAVLLPVRF